jgi:5-formyltetrahydrofolate cyclo-ligase
MNPEIMSVKEAKKAVRVKIGKLRKTLSAEQKKRTSETVFSDIEKLEAFRKANTVLLYWSMDHELPTHDFIMKWYRQKTILLPVTQPDELQLKKFTGRECMRKAVQLHLYEPAGEVFGKPGEVDLAIVPGVAFDRQMNRLGYGKGYYDKLLSGMRAFRIGICFDFQLFDAIPHNELDVKMDMVVAG